MMFKKAQISTEFIIIASVVLVVFLVIFTIIDKRNDEFFASRTKIYVKELCDKVATEINAIFLAGNGATKRIILPETLKDDTDYLVNVYPTSHLVEIQWIYRDEVRQYTCPILFDDLTGDLALLNESYEGVCGDHCVERGFSAGICRQGGLKACKNNDEIPGHGNIHHFCRVELASVCCCVP